MPRPAAYLDECVNVSLAVYLQQRGFAVTIARDVGMVTASDEEQLAYATRSGATLISYDAMDYRRLYHGVRPHGGIILLRNTNFEWQEVRAAMLLDWAATFADFRSQLFRWHDLQQRLIAGERLSGYNTDEVLMALGQIL